jgi:deoxycytidine triphosphate deaminase
MENIGMIPVLLYPKIRICQLVFESLMTPTTMLITKENAKYVDTKHPQESKLEKE